MSTSVSIEEADSLPTAFAPASLLLHPSSQSVFYLFAADASWLVGLSAALLSLAPHPLGAVGFVAVCI
jgi:hypothetical protein